MKRLLAILFLLLPLSLLADFDAYWYFKDGAQIPQTNRLVYVRQISRYTVSETNIITSDRIQKRTDSDGYIVVSNLVAGQFQVTLEGTFATLVITNSFTNGTTGYVNGNSYPFISTNISTGVSAYSVAQANALFYLKANPSNYIGPGVLRSYSGTNYSFNKTNIYYNGTNYSVGIPTNFTLLTGYEGPGFLHAVWTNHGSGWSIDYTNDTSVWLATWVVMKTNNANNSFFSTSYTPNGSTFQGAGIYEDQVGIFYYGTNAPVSTVSLIVPDSGYAFNGVSQIDTNLVRIEMWGDDALPQTTNGLVYRTAFEANKIGRPGMIFRFGKGYFAGRSFYMRTNNLVWEGEGEANTFVTFYQTNYDEATLGSSAFEANCIVISAGSMIRNLTVTNSFILSHVANPARSQDWTISDVTVYPPSAPITVYGGSGSYLDTGIFAEIAGNCIIRRSTIYSSGLGIRIATPHNPGLVTVTNEGTLLLKDNFVLIKPQNYAGWGVFTSGFPLYFNADTVTISNLSITVDGGRYAVIGGTNSVNAAFAAAGAPTSSVHFIGPEFVFGSTNGGAAAIVVVSSPGVQFTGFYKSRAVTSSIADAGTNGFYVFDAITGNAINLTNIPAGQLTGTIPVTANSNAWAQFSLTTQSAAYSYNVWQVITNWTRISTNLMTVNPVNGSITNILAGNYAISASASLADLNGNTGGTFRMVIYTNGVSTCMTNVNNIGQFLGDNLFVVTGVQVPMALTPQVHNLPANSRIDLRIHSNNDLGSFIVMSALLDVVKR